MKKILSFILCIILSLSLFACGEKKGYKDDVSCAEILDTAEEQIPIDGGYGELGGSHIKYNFADTELDDDHAFRHSKLSEDINEFGIFHAPDEKAKRELKELTENYLAQLLEEKGEFISSYAPKELEKLKNAETRVIGNYVAYAILSKDDRALFFDTVEKMLSKQ